MAAEGATCWTCGGADAMGTPEAGRACNIERSHQAITQHNTNMMPGRRSAE